VTLPRGGGALDTPAGGPVDAPVAEDPVDDPVAKDPAAEDPRAGAPPGIAEDPPAGAPPGIAAASRAPLTRAPYPLPPSAAAWPVQGRRRPVPRHRRTRRRRDIPRSEV